jgi:hypothetical protein
MFRRSIKRAGGFIERQNLGLFQQRTGNRQALPLSATQAQTAN